MSPSTSPRNLVATTQADHQHQETGEEPMSTSPKQRKVNMIGAVLAAGLVLPTGMGFALAAEQPSAEDIIKALTPRVTRSLSTSPADTARAAEETRFVDTLRNRTTRSLTAD